jgi:hypothetical protein
MRCDIGSPFCWPYSDMWPQLLLSAADAAAPGSAHDAVTSGDASNVPCFTSATCHSESIWSGDPTELATPRFASFEPTAAPITQ